MRNNLLHWYQWQCWWGCCTHLWCHSVNNSFHSWLRCRYIVYPCHRWGPQPDHLAQIQAGLLISWASCTKSNVRFEKIWKKARWWSTINIFAMPAWICKQSYFLTRWSTWWGGPAGCITWTNVWHLHEWPHGNWASEDLLRHQNPSKSISSETPSWCI